MIDEIISYYKNNLSNSFLIFKHISRAWYFFWLSFFFIFTSSILKNQKFYIFSFVFFCSSLIYLHYKAENLLRDKYSIDSKGEFLGGKDFSKLKTTMLYQYLLERKIDNQEILTSLAQHLYKKAERRKFKGLLLPGVFIVLFLPIWNHVVDWFFTKARFDVEIALTFWALILVGLFFSAVAKFLNKTTEELFNDEYFRIKTLASMIEEISLFLSEYQLLAEKWIRHDKELLQKVPSDTKDKKRNRFFYEALGQVKSLLESVKGRI